MIVVSVLMLPVMICRFYIGWHQLLLVDLPLVIASFISIFVYYLAAQRVLYPKGWRKSFFLIPASGGCRHRAGHHQLARRAGGELGIKSGFVRTPKYNIGTAAAR